MNILQGTPDTTNYLILGYVIIGTVGLGYVLSLWWRYRGLSRDLDVLEALENEDSDQ